MTNLKKLTIVLGRKPEAREEDAKEEPHLPDEGLKLVRCSPKKMPRAPPNTPAARKKERRESNLDLENPRHKAKRVKDRGERWLVDVVEGDRLSGNNRVSMRVQRANILPRLTLPQLSGHFMLQHHICQRYLTHATTDDNNVQFPGITRSNSIVRRPKIARNGELRSLWEEENDTGHGLFLSRYRDGPTATKDGSKKSNRGVRQRKRIYYDTGRSSLSVSGTKKEIEGPGSDFYHSPAHEAQSMYQRSLMRNWAKFCRM
ncbi:PREDICTED: uncharacterized protein LOC109466366 [Branchiostoma belcheri]|uniref:Uncharacterized protein LOC109466366 n=1 Tax=Branchiostoma belcheri TaxID=7741 RepID=A0A6P4YQX0_BRABE|nr:PREDICTED: uncharacterized protein LOC109466366 [Branchiostoma belcheri]